MVDPRFDGSKVRWIQGLVDPRFGGSKVWWIQVLVDPRFGGSKIQWIQGLVDPRFGGSKVWWIHVLVDPCFGGSKVWWILLARFPRLSSQHPSGLRNRMLTASSGTKQDGRRRLPSPQGRHLLQSKPVPPVQAFPCPNACRK